MSKLSKRSRRVADLIQHEIALLIKKEVRDPRLMKITITSVDVSDDLSHAKVYYTPLDVKELHDIKVALEKATGFIRCRLAESVRLRYTPHIQFIYDESVTAAEKLSEIIDTAIEKNQLQHEDYKDSNKSK